ncbi:hypothetical protein AVEN_149204-1 [Araneus ventricosus]|uniref:Uncharacterized protein n=1 Tax=Araneus ventricosus TaxID=182803 RepID=A0A4Y2ILR1_ARAVE|nr:hypothetical protein AVEN_149204-1 [Araneus ventricosus]
MHNNPLSTLTVTYILKKPDAPEEEDYGSSGCALNHNHSETDNRIYALATDCSLQRAGCCRFLSKGNTNVDQFLRIAKKATCSICRSEVRLLPQVIPRRPVASPTENVTFTLYHEYLTHGLGPICQHHQFK